MNPLRSLLPILCVALVSCNDDFGTARVTYTRATAVYGDLESLRQTPLLGSAREISNPGKIFVSGEILLIGEEGAGIHVFDNRDEYNPSPISFLNIPQNREFFIHENMVYAESIYDLVKIDISDIHNPQLVSRSENSIYEPMTNNRGQAIVAFSFEEITENVDINSPAYKELNEYPVQYFDFANNVIPRSAVPTSFAGSSNRAIGSVNRIAFYNNYVYLVSRSIMSIYQDQGEISLVNKYPGTWNMETIFPFEDKLYVGSQNAMHVYNISMPADPIEESWFWHEMSCDPVYPVDENTAYVTLRTGDFSECPGDINALIVVETRQNTGARSLQEIEMKSPFGMTMIDDRLFVAEGEYGFKIFDASNHRDLQLIKWLKDIPVYDIIAHPEDSGLILIAGPDGFSQYRISSELDLDHLSTIRF